MIKRVGVIGVGHVGLGMALALKNTEPTTVSYCHNTEDTLTPTSLTFENTQDYTNITFTYCDSHNKEDEYWINYWHAIELRSYWHQPKVIGKPFKPQIKPLMGFARSKLRKHKLKPELCLK